MSYTDELEAVLDAEQALRLKIAREIAQERGEADASSDPSLDNADAAIEAWAADGEEDHDARAFRPLTPLQVLLADHRAICDRILDIRDRRLS